MGRTDHLLFPLPGERVRACPEALEGVRGKAVSTNNAFLARGQVPWVRKKNYETNSRSP